MQKLGAGDFSAKLEILVVLVQKLEMLVVLVQKLEMLVVLVQKLGVGGFGAKAWCW